MSKKLYEIVSKVFNVDTSKINDDTLSLMEKGSYEFCIMMWLPIQIMP